MLTIKTFGHRSDAPAPAPPGCYAQASPRRLRSGLGGRISADDLATLDTLTGSDVPGSVLNATTSLPAHEDRMGRQTAISGQQQTGPCGRRRHSGSPA